MNGRFPSLISSQLSKSPTQVDKVRDYKRWTLVDKWQTHNSLFPATKKCLLDWAKRFDECPRVNKIRALNGQSLNMDCNKSTPKTPLLSRLKSCTGTWPCSCQKCLQHGPVQSWWSAVSRNQELHLVCYWQSYPWPCTLVEGPIKAAHLSAESIT